MSSNGTVQNAIDYYPYGKAMPTRNTFATNYEGYRYQFTGHERDGETSYQYHGARYYDEDLARYMSVDRFATKFFHQSPYVYAGNMPINSIDHNGDSVLFYSESGKYLGYSHDNQRYKDQNLLSIIADKEVKNFQEQYEIKRNAKYTSNTAREANVAGLEAMGTTYDITSFRDFYEEYKNKRQDDNGNIIPATGLDNAVEFGAPLSRSPNPVHKGENNWKTVDDKNVVTSNINNHVVWSYNLDDEIHLHTGWLNSSPSADDLRRQEKINEKNPKSFGILINSERITFYRFDFKSNQTLGIILLNDSFKKPLK
jgi:RHS repeat-associated protein